MPRIVKWVGDPPTLEEGNYGVYKYCTRLRVLENGQAVLEEHFTLLVLPEDADEDEALLMRPFFVQSWISAPEVTGYSPDANEAEEEQKPTREEQDVEGMTGSLEV